MNLIELVNSVKLIRLNEDLVIINKGIEENVQVEKDEKDNIFKKFGKNINNSIKKNRTEGLEKNKKDDEDAIEKIKKDYPNSTSEVSDLEKELEGILSSIDGKYVFSILYLLSDDHEYKDEEGSLKKISTLLLNDENKLFDVRKNLNSHYNKIANGLFSSIKSSDAVLFALQGYLLSLPKVKEGKFTYSLTKDALDKSIAKEEDKKAAITMASLILMGNKGMNFSKDDEGEESFFALDKTNVQVALAIRAYLVSILKSELTIDEVKEDVSAILTSLSKLSLSCQKLMIIEKKDQDNAKQKLIAINNFIDDIASIL